MPGSAWTAERTARFKKTMALRRAEREREDKLQDRPKPKKEGSGVSKFALVYLKQAKKDIIQRLRDGGDLNDSDLLTLLALRELE